MRHITGQSAQDRAEEAGEGVQDDHGEHGRGEDHREGGDEAPTRQHRHSARFDFIQRNFFKIPWVHYYCFVVQNSVFIHKDIKLLRST